MTIIIFLLILLVLILVHEFGHFIVAKKSGIRVDEFGIGFPPKLFGIKKGETEYTFNLFPIGGFVRIFGENPDEESIKSERSLINKPKYIQALVLVAGVTFNVIFAWIVFSIIFMVGMPVPITESTSDKVTNIELIIGDVIKDSPAEGVSLLFGDKITSLSYGDEVVLNPNSENTPEFIASHDGVEIEIGYTRGGDTFSAFITPVDGIIGVALSEVGILKLGFFSAIYEGLIFTGKMVVAITVGIVSFLWSALLLQADLSEIAGPVGIVGLVGDASTLGIVSLLSFMAIISIDLAVINLLPFPALDGGRLLFVVIEAIKGSPMNPKIANTANAIGFTLLIILMVAVTYNDVLRIFQ